MKKAALVFGLLFLAAAAPAAPRAPLPQFAGETTLEALRFSMPAMRGAQQAPAKPTRVYTYTRTFGNETWEEKRSSALDLWREAQTAGTWVDRAGNALTLARARYSFPTFAQGVVTEDAYETVLQADFDAAVSDPAWALGRTATPAALAAWGARFAGVAVSGEPTRLPINGARLAALWEVPLADPAARLYLFRFDPNHAGQAGAADAWLAALFRFAEPPPPDGSADRLLRSAFLPSLRALGRFAGSGAADPKARPRPSERGRPPAQIPQGGRRTRALATIEMLDAWWHMDSPHFVILSDVPGGDAAADCLLSVLESLRPRYAAVVPRFPEAAEETSVVRFFRSDEEFARYFEGTHLALAVGETAGWFDPMRGELVIRPAKKEFSGTPDATVRHEGFHQWLHQAWPQTRIPTWFNEGTAEFFECYEPRGNGAAFDWKENAAAAAWLQRLARDKDADWPRLLRAVLLSDQATFYNPPHFGGKAADSYGFAWGLMYFLHRGAPQLRNQPWKDVLPTFYRTLLDTHDGTRATLAAFRLGADGTDTALLERFAADLQDFWRNESARRNARSARIP